MNSTVLMADEDPKNVVPLFPAGRSIYRHRNHPMVQAAETLEEKKKVARLLDFQAAKEKQEAEDKAEQAKLTCWGRVSYAVTGFLFGAIPTAINNTLNKLAKQDKQKLKP